MATGPELRIGLVLYGGVSLAIYIYGVVVEVQRLLAAAAELEGDREETAYARALAAAGISAATVDIVSGTSAGGINGILLAKALARRADVRGVRELWVEDGDIGQLLQPPSVREPRSLLRSERFEGAIRRGFELLDERAGTGGANEAPILDLFVPSTHLRGGQRIFTDSLGRQLATRQHRYVFRLKLRRSEFDLSGSGTGGRDDFADNERLIKAARATSAFPVAFEPKLIARADGLLGAEDGEGWFADGGILNNKPFTEAVEAILTRHSVRPVRRWLFSLDPDPDPAEADPGPAADPPPFDQVLLRSVASIPRYQSIARDLRALREHNAKVDAAEEAVRAGEADLAEAGPGDGGLGPGVRAVYGAMRRQAWGAEVADAIVRAVRPAFPDGAVDWSAAHRTFRLQAETVWREGLADAAYERRRIYYMIKLLAIADEVEEGDLEQTRRALWTAFETISSAFRWAPPADWEDDLPDDPADDAAGLVERLVKGTGFDADAAAAVTGPLRDGLRGVVLGLRHGGDRFRVRLTDVLERFEQRDATLLAAQVYGGLRERDRVRHARISPLDAENTGIPGRSKLGGVSLGHFGGFLDAGWRENDIMWGRLDGAEILIGAILAGGDDSLRAELTDAAQEEVLAEELPSALEHPSGWKEGLRERHGDGPSFGDLDRRRLAGTAFRAAAVVRRMLATAAQAGAAAGLHARVRAALLRGGANLLGFLIAYLYLPAMLAVGRGPVVQVFATTVAVLPPLFGLAALLLGCAGVFSLGAVPLVVWIVVAIYPAALLVVWLVRWIMIRLRRPDGPPGAG